MPIIPLRPILEATKKLKYAQGAFNVNAVAQAEAVIKIHEILRSPAILQGADLANAFMGGCKNFKNGTIEDKKKGAANIAGAIKEVGCSSSIPIAIHLDHGKDFESVKAAIDNGYTSVMIDGSHLPYEENIELTREVVKYAHDTGVTVEGELGVLAGMEDNVFSKTSTYTNPMQVCDFVTKTKVDCLAVSYGTSHGAQKGKNLKLRQEIIVACAENLMHQGVFCVLVSHGSSTVPKYIVNEINSLGGKLPDTQGVPVNQLLSVIPHGVGKINIDTDIRLAVTRNTWEFFLKYPEMQESLYLKDVYNLLSKKPDNFDPRLYLTGIYNTVLTGAIPTKDVEAYIEVLKNGVMEVVGTLIVKFGSLGKASQIEIVDLGQMAERYKAEGI